jgi:hypothetical protein
VEAAPQTEAEPKRTEATTVAKQLEIDWTRARQLMVLASAEIADAEIVEGNTPRKVRAVVLKAVLQAIDHHGRGKAAWISYETLAREACICVRQAKRAIIALQQESLIVTDTRKCNHYSIVWSELNLRCPSHRQLAPLESAAPDPQPEPSPADSTATERSALRAQRSALGTQRSALGTQRSALEGTRTVPEPHKNRSEPPPPTPSQPNGGGGGWEMIVSEWRTRISQIALLVKEAQSAGQTCDEFLARLRFAWEVAEHPANKGKSVRKPAGAVVYWMRMNSWPAEGVIEDPKLLSNATQRIQQRSSETVWVQTVAKLDNIIRAGRRAQRSDDEIKQDMIRASSVEDVSRYGW